MDKLSGIIRNLYEDFKTDVHSGATEITRKAVKCLTVFSEETDGSASTYWNDLICLSRSLIQAQPSMASLFTLANTVAMAVQPLKESATVEPLKRATREAALRFQQTSDAALDAISQHGQGLITTDCTVFTHSSSSTVVGILRNALRQGKTINAIATESRPYCEGRELGRALGQQGIHTRLILDAAIAQYVKQADIVLVGVDRFSEESFVNKVGTLAIAMAAKNEQVPVYAACETSKFLPASVRPLGDVMGSSEEKSQEEWQNVELIHSFFEETPNSFLAGIITEEGILSMNALSKRFKAFRVCEELLP